MFEAFEYHKKRLRCPVCLESLEEPIPDQCPNLHTLNRNNDIPVLISDPLAIQELIEHKTAEIGRADWYTESQSNQAIGPFRHHLRRRRKFVETVLKGYLNDEGLERASSLLDLGCGDGENLQWLRKYADRIYASDYNSIRMTRVTSCAEEQVYLADITNYPALDNSFEIIFFNHVLEHIPDHVQAISEVARITQPGGIVVLGIPNEGALFGKLAYKFQPSSRKTTDHVHFYTMHEILGLCELTDLKVQETKYLGYGIPHWSLDSHIRKFRILESIFENVGRFICPRQASSIYVILRKNADCDLEDE